MSVSFDCYEIGALGLSIDTNKKASLCVSMLDTAIISYLNLRGAIRHSDHSSQYTSRNDQKTVQYYGIHRMNHFRGRYHHNAQNFKIKAYLLQTVKPQDM